jgi:conjugal transfer/entry exclusion protein
MKTKSITNKINYFINLVNSWHKKYEITLTGADTEKLNILKSDLDAAQSLQKEVQTLKDTLKSRKKDLKNAVIKLKEDKSEFKKVVKNIKKAAKKIKAVDKPKVVIPVKKKSSGRGKKKSKK